MADVVTRMRDRSPSPILLAVLAILLPVPAHAAGLGAFGVGLVAPLGMLVHLAGLLVLGLWLAAEGGRASGQGVAVALAAAVLFAVLAAFGIRIPYVGLVLEGSLVVFGGLVALAMTLPAALAIVLAAVAGAAHGVALAGWAGVPTNPWLFWPGLACGGLLLSCAGIGLATALPQVAGPTAVRVTGALAAILGVLMLLGVV